MKKKLVTFLLAALMVVGATTTAFAAPSPEIDSPEINSPEIDSPGADDEFEDVVVDATDIENMSDAELDRLAAALVVPEENIEGSVVTFLAALEAATLRDAAAQLEAGSILAAMDIEVADQQPTLTFSGLAVDANDNITILHQLADGTWENFAADNVADGEVTATFNSLSPVVIVKDAKLVATTPDTEEPGTPDTEEPGTPDTEEPGTPDTEEPGTPDTEEPGTDDPTSPITGATVVLPMIAIAGLAGATVFGKKANK